MAVEEEPVDTEAATMELPAVGAAGSAESSALAELVGLEGPTLRRPDVERLVGLPHSQMVRWWRAMGFAEVPEDLVAFGDTDVEMARSLAALADLDALDEEDILRLGRVLGASFSRIAEAQSAVLEELLPDVRLEHGRGPAARVRVLSDTLGTDHGRLLLEMLEDSVLYVWRRHLLAALSRWAGAGEVAGEQAVAFADVSNFSALTKSLRASEISAIVDNFEATAFDVVATHDGRVVKLIGDEVMFVAEDVGTAVDVCLELLERCAQGPHAIQLHCGVAHGPTITIGGDVFGPTANLASRLTDVARRGRVVLPREQANDLAGREDLVVRPVRRVFDLKGIGRTRLSTVARRVPLAGDADGAGR